MSCAEVGELSVAAMTGFQIDNRAKSVLIGAGIHTDFMEQPNNSAITNIGCPCHIMTI